jgi:hypothetical protein
VHTGRGPGAGLEYFTNGMAPPGWVGPLGVNLNKFGIVYEYKYTDLEGVDKNVFSVVYQVRLAAHARAKPTT